MVPPALLLELPRGEVLLVGALLRAGRVEDEEERVRVELLEDRRRVEDGGGRLEGKELGVGYGLRGTYAFGRSESAGCGMLLRLALSALG